MAGLPASVRAETASPQSGLEDMRSMIDRYCADCHNIEDWAGGVAFDVLALEDVSRDADVWEASVRKLLTGMMPPAGEPRPERAAMDGFTQALGGKLDEAWAHAPDPGTEGISRLNRAEYANAVRDLLALDIDVEASLPADDAIGGFDNIADALSVSPTLIERYLSVAMRLSREAVGDTGMAAREVTYNSHAEGAQLHHIEGLPLGTRGGLLIRHNFPLDATYDFTISAGARGFLSQGDGPDPDVIVTLDGNILQIDDPSRFRLSLDAGPHSLGVALADQAHWAGATELHDVYAMTGAVRSLTITGPFDATGPGDTPSRRAVFRCYPQSAAEEEPCARRIMADLATKAFRRPTDADSPDVNALMTLYEDGARRGGFEDGIKSALARLLVDPRFLYRLEAEPEGLAPGEIYRISDLELASRLSFFLWSSIPDDKLLHVAAEDRLSDPATLRAQTARMLADPKADALIENFVGQWLKLRDLKNAEPQVRAFDEDLRRALAAETRMLFEDILRDDKSILTIIDAPYTYVNERLADHYGIAGVHGSYMRRVTTSDPARRGVLGHGSFLTTTSVANRTSPVVRGVWVLENLLGAHVPPPPPGVETDLSQSVGEIEPTTLRRRLEMHLTNEQCAACHEMIDPIGYTLEHFDLVGRWRDADNGFPIDATATLTDGTQLGGVADLRQALLARSQAVATAFTEKLLTYALGRTVAAHDQPAIRAILQEARDEGYRFSDIVQGIVASPPFQMKSAAGDEAPEQRADLHQTSQGARP